MKRRAVLGLMAAGLLPAACASPPTHYYTLVATAGQAVPGAPRTVMLRRPGIAGYLDRPDLVRSGGTYQLQVASDERWGEPFGELLGRILSEDLGRRLPGTSVYAEAGAISASPDATLEIDFQRFDVDPTGPVVLLVQWSVERGRGNPGGPPTTDRITVAPASRTTSDVVAAMSEALGQASDRIAAALRALPPPSSPDGPGRTRRPGR